jgi:ribosomal-protein-alanine N-acetyltransferase
METGKTEENVYMFIDLETERLYLKCIGYDDAEFFYKQFSTREVNQYLFDTEPCSSVEEAERWIGFYLKSEPRNQHRWIIILKENCEKIGTCGFHCWNRETGEIEMGYDLQPSYWRNGYTSEALTAIMKFAAEEMKVKKIFAHISVDNIASIRTCEKVGFMKTGEQYYEEFHGEKYLHDIYCFDLEANSDLLYKD